MVGEGTEPSAACQHGTALRTGRKGRRLLWIGVVAALVIVGSCVGLAVYIYRDFDRTMSELDRMVSEADRMAAAVERIGSDPNRIPIVFTDETSVERAEMNPMGGKLELRCLEDGTIWRPNIEKSSAELKRFASTTRAESMPASRPMQAEWDLILTDDKGRDRAVMTTIGEQMEVRLIGSRSVWRPDMEKTVARLLGRTSALPPTSALGSGPARPTTRP